MKALISTIYTFFALWGGDIMQVEVVRVVDGDTVIVRPAGGKPGEPHPIRLYGIDAAELKGKCLHEVFFAQIAHQAMKTMMPEGDVVWLRTRWKRDSYDRIIGRITTDGLQTDVADRLVAGNAAQYWLAATPKPRWCPPPKHMTG